MTSGVLKSILSIFEKKCVELGVETRLCETVSQQLIKSHAGSEEGRFIVNLSGRGAKDARINDDVIISLCECWDVARFTHLDLSYNSIDNVGLENLSEKVKQDKFIISLNVSFNDFSGESVDPLMKALHFNDALTLINLSGCKLGTKGGLMVASMLQVNQSLQELVLASCDITTDVIIAIATVLNFNKSIRKIDLSRPILFSKQSETAMHLGKMLKVNRTLTELKLSKFGLTDFDINELCVLMKENNTLQSLDLSNNKIAQDGAKHLGNFLKYNATLKHLDLTANRIEDPGMTAISDVIRIYNSTLVSLKIGFNNIGRVGLCNLATALTLNSTINCIYLWGNKLEVETCEAFRDLLESETPRFPTNRNHIDIVPYSVDGVTYLAELN